jgi:hypothetical protein
MYLAPSIWLGPRNENANIHYYQQGNIFKSILWQYLIRGKYENA